VAVGAGALLGGCSVIYYDRRETVALGAQDHIDNNRVAQMIDPWPRDVGRRQIAFNGQKMQSAVERYRTNRVTRPIGLTTSTTYRQTEQPAADTSPTSQTPSAPAAPVK